MTQKKVNPRVIEIFALIGQDTQSGIMNKKYPRTPRAAIKFPITREMKLLMIKEYTELRFEMSQPKIKKAAKLPGTPAIRLNSGVVKPKKDRAKSPMKHPMAAPTPPTTGPKITAKKAKTITLKISKGQE